MDWKEAALERYRSRKKIGEAVRRRLTPKQQAQWDDRAIGNQVAMLFKGKTTWWRDTGAVVLDELAEMLSVSTEELLGASGPVAGSLDFPEFPALPPLAPDEPPFASPKDEVFALALEFRGGEARSTSRRWIVAAPGYGKSFVVRYLAARASTPFVARSVETLEAALPFVANRSTKLIVEVERSAPSDRDAYRELTAATQSCTVLAPFPIPDESWGSDSTVRTTTSGWTQLRAAPFSEWRDEFARWVVRRVEQVPGRDTHLDVDALAAWLERHDPDCTLVASPGDLLALCADIDCHGDRQPSLSARAERWLRDVGVPRIGDAMAGTTNTRLAGRAYRGMLESHLTRLDVDLVRTVTPDWEQLVPAMTSTRSPSGEPAGPIAVAAFAEAGLLRGDKLGIAPFPRWVAQGVREQLLVHAFDGDDTSAWGRYAADDGCAFRRT